MDDRDDDVPEILAFGEAMVEFNQTGQEGGRLYLQGFGGDTSNFAIAAARQGARVGYLSALGDDPYGRLLRALWQAEGVDQAGVRTDPAAFTAIYFVTHDEGGHHFHFFRAGSAASRCFTAARLARLGSTPGLGSSTAKASASVISCVASVRPGEKGAFTSWPALLAASSTAALPPSTIKSARETFFLPVCEPLNSAWIFSSVPSTVAN